MRLIDTHCHLDFPEFESDLDTVVRRAEEAGVVGMVCVGTSVVSSIRCVEIAHRYPSVFASVGVHPSESRGLDSTGWETIQSLAREPKVVAVGETGLDYRKGNDPSGLQREVFGRHVRLAAETGLPLIVHQRQSAQDVMRVLDEYPAVSRVVFHCFGGDGALAEYCREKGFFISFTGVLTFPNAEEVRTAARQFPLERILLETDAPFLSPAPLRGRRNEPARIRLILEKLAAVRGLDAESCAVQMRENSRAFFGTTLP